MVVCKNTRRVSRQFGIVSKNQGHVIYFKQFGVIVLLCCVVFVFVFAGEKMFIIIVVFFWSHIVVFFGILMKPQTQSFQDKSKQWYSNLTVAETKGNLYKCSY